MDPCVLRPNSFCTGLVFVPSVGVFLGFIKLRQGPSPAALHLFKSLDSFQFSLQLQQLRCLDCQGWTVGVRSPIVYRIYRICQQLCVLGSTLCHQYIRNTMSSKFFFNFLMTVSALISRRRSTSNNDEW